MIDLLRIDLAGTTCSVLDLVQLLRSVKFEGSKERTSVVNNADVALSSSVKSSVLGTREIPESVEFLFCPYPSIAEEISYLTVRVECAIRVNTDDCTFSLTPLPGQVEAANVRAQELVMKAIAERDHSFTIYSGRYGIAR